MVLSSTCLPRYVFGAKIIKKKAKDPPHHPNCSVVPLLQFLFPSSLKFADAGGVKGLHLRGGHEVCQAVLFLTVFQKDNFYRFCI